LSEAGREQARRLGRYLQDTKVSAVYSSPLERCLDTARAIACFHKIEVQIEPDLREIEAGELEGVPISELRTTFSQLLVQWRDGKGAEKLPGGESMADLGDRVWPVVQRIVSRHRERAVVIVSHYFVILATICKALGWPMTHIDRIRVPIASMSTLDFSGEYLRLASLGDSCHLREG